MKYLAAIALLAAVCIALSCGQARRGGNGPGASGTAPGGSSTDSAEGATGTGAGALARPGTVTAPSEVRPMNWWLAGFLAFGTAAVLYLLDWLGDGEGG